MVFTCSSVVFVSRLQCTFGQCTNRQVKIVDKNMTMTKKPVDALAHWKYIQRWGGEHTKQLPGLTAEHVGAWFPVWVVKHVQQICKENHNFEVNFQN